ncbi:MAG TPA: hypothetical protein VIE86_03305 [Nitrososphaera sp.]
MSPDVDMVLLTPDEINRFISNLRSRYGAAPAARRSSRIRTA